MKAEDRFVETLRQFLPDCGRVLVGPGDDAALVKCTGPELAATTDLLVEGVDFLTGDDPERIGRRAVAVNISDLAAVGANAEFFLLSIAFPPDKGPGYALGIARGAISQAIRFGACLAGGDLSSAPTTVVSAAFWGSPAGKPILRSGARPGDALWISGFPGRAAAGLRLARKAMSDDGAPVSSGEAELLAAYRDPVPRLALGVWLAREEAARAAIDVSDGLGVDAARLARASGVKAVIERDRIPISPALARFAEKESADPMDWILAGGDDYELLFAVPEAAADRLTPPRPEWEVTATKIGHIESGQGAVLRDGRGDRDISGMGFDHWESAP